MREAKPRKIKAKICGGPKGGGEEEERLPVEIRWDTGKLSQLVEVKGPVNCKKCF